jgi:hypothetical protein
MSRAPTSFRQALPGLRLAAYPGHSRHATGIARADPYPRILSPEPMHPSFTVKTRPLSRRRWVAPRRNAPIHLSAQSRCRQLAVTNSLAVAYVLAEPSTGNRVSDGDGLDEAMTRISAPVVAGQDARRHHIGVGARRGTAAAGLLPVSLLAQQRLTETVELGDHLLRRRGNGLTGPFA